MDIELIKRYVLGSKRYIDIIEEGYVIPKLIFGDSGNKIYLEKIRKNLKENQDSDYSIMFRKDLKILSRNSKMDCSLYRYVREFPIIIEDRDLWEILVEQTGIIDKKDSKYFLLDYFFPYLGLIVEIDSQYHKYRKNYDYARDLYIKNKYGIDTVRFYEYGKDDQQRKLCIEEFNKRSKNLYKNKINNWNLVYDKYPINFDKTVINNFIQENSNILHFIDNLIEFYGRKFYIDNLICIKVENLNKIDSLNFPIQMVNIIPGSFEDVFIGSASRLLLDIYGKMLKLYSQ